jgi:putative transposase
VEFARLAHTFEELERTSSRLALIDLLTEPFRSVERPEELERVCYLVQGRVAPFFEALEMGMAEKTVARSIAIAAHSTPEEVLQRYATLGDMGLVAEQLWKEEASGLRTSLGRRASLWYTNDHLKHLYEEGTMNCPYCVSTATKERTKNTSLGYRTFCCSDCRRTFNERTGTPFNFLEYPTDIVLLVVLWRLRYKLSLRDLAEMFLERGFEFTHEAVRDWEARFAPLMADQLRAKRRGQAGRSWYVDETYVNVKGKWCYLYRAIDRDGNLVDSMVSEKRDMEAAKRFFKQAVDVVGHAPERVTTDGHDSYPRAIRETLGSEVLHRTNRYLNNRLEQDHRGIKQRYYPMRGFGSVASAARFCRAFDEVRQFFRIRTTMKQKVSLAHQREVFRHQLEALKAIVLVA